MPIPNYLKEIGFNETRKAGRTCFEARCPCGCEKFHIYKNKFTKEEKALMKPHDDAWRFYCNVSYPDGTQYKRDENGKWRHYIIKECVWEEIKEIETTPEMATDYVWNEKGELRLYYVKSGVWEELEIPEMPPFASTEAYKAACSECGREFILFDNRFYGYDAVLASEGMKRDLEYKPTYAQKKFKDGKPRRLFFQIENFDTLEEFCKDMEEEYDEVTFSNSFSWIWVYIIDENGKKSKLFEYETA
ncbi:MAG: hypothetical protein IJX27_01775 [Clostridia bacterium]|nr:hypothetical protein [Clostridia bacterium]